MRPAPLETSTTSQPCCFGQRARTTLSSMVHSRKLIASVTELALKQGRPLSDYAALYDWDEQVGQGYIANDLRALFVEAGDCPNFVEELDANGGQTLLMFVFANNGYDRTVTITSRGFVVGSAGQA